MLSSSIVIRTARAAASRAPPRAPLRRLLASRADTVREEHHRLYDAREAEFALFALEKVPGDRATYAAVLEACQDFGRTWGHLDPVLDKSPPVLVPGTETADGKNEVVTAPETKQLVAAFRDAGFAELSTAGLPFAVRCAALSTLGAAFPANAMGLFVLTSCAADLLEAHGSDALKAAYLPQLRSSEFMGTMALSEAHAGSSLAAIRTAAVPVDGPPDPLGQAYSVKGDKMWTSGAFHDLAGNIVHMLLARLPDAPPGAGGISLLLVPNVLPDGTKNAVECVSLNKKMGHRAISNAAWTLDGATGYLVGQPHGGLAAMFGMMNAMRIEVGLGAACLGKRGLQESLLYAQEREQGGRKIVEHDDVKRMLLLQKAYAEGSTALCLHAAALHDRAGGKAECVGGDALETDPRDAAKLLAVLTEVVKSWPSEWCLEANKLAIQVLGGAGYVQDYPLEQIYRDNRLNMIHEGTAGIHALTLLGRKVQGGRAEVLFAAMRATAAKAGDPEGAAAVRAAADRLERVTAALTAPEAKAEALVNAHDYLTLFGHSVIAWQWLRTANAAAEALAADESAADSDARLFYQGKLATATFFWRHELPKTEALENLLLSGDTSVRDMQPGWF